MSQRTPVPSIEGSVRPTRRRVSSAAAVLLLIGATMIWVGATSEPADAATIAVNQCNFNETGAAREIRCDVTVVNTLDVATGITSSTVTTTVCEGAPGAALCVTTPGAATTDIVNSVNQCNNSANAGGSVVTCNVNVVNTITGTGSTSPATVNQCIGSGQGGGAAPTTLCVPPTAVVGADVIQCNTAGNGGGATERVKCTVPTSTVSALWPVTIVQCNDSANGGGDLVTCNAQITSTVLAAAPAPTTTTTAAPAAPAVPVTIAPDSTGGGGAPTTPVAGGPNTPVLPRTGSTTSGLIMAGTLLIALGVVAIAATRRRAA